MFKDLNTYLKGLDTGLRLSLNESMDLLDNKSLKETDLVIIALDD